MKLENETSDRADGVVPRPIPYPLVGGSSLTHSAAMWAHLGPLVAAVIAGILYPLSVLVLPLLWLPVLLIRRSPNNRGDALVRNHTAQSLNSILTGYVALVVAIGVTVLAVTSGMLESRMVYISIVAIGFTISVWGYAVVRGIAAIVFAIIGATRARVGLFMRFPRWVALGIVHDATPPS